MSADTPKPGKSLDSSSEFKTPTRKGSDKLNSNVSRTPIQIPPSPLLEKLGFGTGMNKIFFNLPDRLLTSNLIFNF